MSVENNIQLVRQFTEAVINQHQFERIDDFWAPDMLWHGGSMGDLDGIEAFRKFLTSSVNGAFINMKLEIVYAIGQEDMVSMYFTNSGINAGAFLGNPATNKYAQWNGMSFYRISGDKICEAWFSEDLLQMFLQLGFIKL